MAGFNDAPIIQKLAVPGVTLLILFLGYSSQYLFLTAADLAPGPLTSSQLYSFNGLLLCLWFTYYKACTVDPGRYVFTSKTHEVPDDDNDNGDKTNSSHDDNLNSYARWCRKCEAPKPPRAHHCRTCRRCIPKMDHHCPWTTNCVSLTTLPHFLRFLVYTNLALAYLSYLLFLRFAALCRAEIMDELEEREEYDMLDGDAEDGVRLNDAAGGAAWTNSDGERLYDYGVDEDAENTELDLRHTIVGEADDDVPLAELLRRRKIRQKDGEE
ncbi:hypothetical protein VdG1_06701 [Verticillium dahliae VDG1]|nr:hypothetical protein VdG1_06701 [Verticillium dahliae VDG1]